MVKMTAQKYSLYVTLIAVFTKKSYLLSLSTISATIASY